MATKRITLASVSNATVSTENFDACLKLFTTSARVIDEMAQKLVIFGMEHAFNTGSDHKGDTSYIARLLDNFPKGMRRNDMVSWIVKYAPLIIKIKDGAKASVRHMDPSHENFVPWDIEGAKANPWFEDRRPAAIDTELTFDDVKEKVVQLHKYITNKMKGGYVKESDREMVNSLTKKIAAIDLTAQGNINPAQSEAA